MISFDTKGREALVMSEVNFDSKAFTYERTALVQKSASEILLNLLSIQPGENVLDLGCGPGNITKKIAQITDGTVMGVDASRGMIEKAISANQDLPNIKYTVMNAEDLELCDRFNAIVCNSSFQCFQNPEQALRCCFNVLKHEGKIGVQAPATQQYCPNFVSAIEMVQRNPCTQDVFKCFQSPWFFLESKEEYGQFFRNCGFHVLYCEFIDESNHYSVEEVYKIFQSGAENGYLNQSFYTVALNDDYIEAFRGLIKESFKEQSDSSGMIDLKFKRIYLIAKK
jgi:ubiquinone/menaquinone biosynthesis C-methylase UbiE